MTTHAALAPDLADAIRLPPQGGGSSAPRPRAQARVSDDLQATDHAIGAAREAVAGLEAARIALQHSQKMEAVGEMTVGLAHDFNNLLSAISSSLELTQRRLSRHEFERLESSLSVAQASTARAAAVATRLLAFARGKVDTAQVADVNHVVAGLADLVRQTIVGDVRLEFDYASENCPAMIDPNQCENALLNLCINARDAMPDGGVLTIATSRRTLEGATAAALAVTPGCYVAVDVRDTGTGMPPEVVRRMFEPFFTTKAHGRGTGFGLAMVHGFAKEASGAVVAMSSVGHGTIVTLYLPFAGGVSAARGARQGRGAP